MNHRGIGPVSCRAAVVLASWLVSANLALSQVVDIGAFKPDSEILAYGLSADGSTVVGVAQSTPKFKAFRWTRAGGMEDLGELPDDTGLRALAVSGDGSVVAGGSNYEAFRWTRETGSVGLGHLPGGRSSIATAVSRDGAVIAGMDYSRSTHGFRWTKAGGMEDIGLLPDGHEMYVTGTNADGSVIVGYGSYKPAWRPNAVRWTKETGPVDLGLPVGAKECFANAVSAEGDILVGAAKYSDVYRPVRWDNGSGWTVLGDPFPGFNVAYATAVSDDGSTIIGAVGHTTGKPYRAFIWRDDTGLVNLNDFLPSIGIDLTGWVLEDARGLSADGKTISGWGQHDGQTRSWIVTIPSPASGAPTALASALFARRRRAVFRAAY